MSLLQINQINKVKGNTTLIPDITLSVKSGQCIVIQCQHELGLQFIHSLIGKESISSGSILFENQMLNQSFKTLSPYIALSFLQDGLYPTLKVIDYLNFFKSIYNSDISLQATLHLLSLDDVKHKVIETLSFSQQKRIHLARCIIQNPKLIVLEEPEQNIDMESQILIRKAIVHLCKKGVALLITSGYLSNALSITDEVYTLTTHDFKKIELAEDTSIHSEATISNSIVNEQQIHSVVETSNVQTNEHNVEDNQNISPSISKQEEVTSTAEVLPLRVEKIPAKVEDKIILFDPTEIDFIESHDGICLLQVKCESFPCMFTMNELEQKLRMFGFFRCHRSYIVNLQKVREVITWTRNSFSLILDDKKKSSIPLSKNKYDELKTIMGI